MLRLRGENATNITPDWLVGHPTALGQSVIRGRFAMSWAIDSRTAEGRLDVVGLGDQLGGLSSR